MSNNWDIIYTFHIEPIHLEHLQQSNPNANILLCDLSQYGLFLNQKYCWRNSDIFIRNWLRCNRSSITRNNIAIVEWDVLITKPLPDICVHGLMCNNIQHSYQEWYWFKESKLLSAKYEKFKIGVTPLCVLFMDQYCIDTIIDSEFDPIFSANIFCELRLPTILNSRNINITKYSMPNVNSLKTTYDENIPDIYHPIKQKICRPYT